MKRLLFVFLILFISSSCSNELNGWDKVTWGMTIEQVKNIYDEYSESIAPENQNTNIKGLKLQNETFGDIPVISYLKFENNSLSAVRVLHTYKDETPKSVRLSVLTPEYKEFESLLIKRYGQPDFINELKSFGWFELGWFAGNTNLARSPRHRRGAGPERGRWRRSARRGSGCRSGTRSRRAG